ncbi:MAG TPA: GNAT family N-acetyltransferase [Candidatus Acidoferrum sp.]|nr:GNAT family N-acetyltransferase [Candidatus Acidoferrum sp.]
MSVTLANTEDPVTTMAKADLAERVPEILANVRVYEGLDELPKSFLNLFEEAGRESIFLTLPWFQNFVRTAMTSEDRVRIYTATGAQGTPAGMLLMRNSGSSSPARKLEALSNYYSCFYAPHLGAPAKRSRETLLAMTRAIAREQPRWDQIEIKPLENQSSEYSELVEAFKAAGFVVQTFFSFGNWYLPVSGRSFTEYSESLPSVLKNTLSRKRKKLEKTGRARIEIVTGGQGLDAAIDSYMKVYLSSWKQPEPYPEFVPSLIRMCAQMGALRLGLIHVDGEPAAAQLWIVHHGNALIYKLAYDERFAELSVGTILSATLFEHALDVDKVKEVDYLSGDDAYKKDWMSERRERWGILALNPRTPRGLLAIARHVGGRAVKRAAVSLAKTFQRGKSANTAE